jgi:hypothetical protein
MTNLYRSESSNPKWNAQRNLNGRTHYVDDDTLRFHKSRILSARHTDNGLLFAIVESMALDMHNTKRGYRYVIFDLFGSTIDRPKLEDSYRTSRQATAAMWAALNAIDAKAITLAAIDQQAKNHIREIADLTKLVQSIDTAKAA